MKKLVIGLSLSTLAVGLAAIAKKMMDKKYGDEDLNDQEIPAQIDTEEDYLKDDEDLEESENLKADAINQPYEPIKY
ncbi:hypothetical protein [Lactobacillus kefiranofaciens]|uniref:Uncharacterized protein n=1 Tax=Lactobacillus kefiranofaciens TaxID=267818 RepID=A0AAX3UFF6_9LACO|nr:hypothetical protein [Lactobacillus kefiranofaciens]AEG40356.1 Cell division protein ZipA [Lactobacillus kefiranofaciens subsp. kefiranofaciens]KRL23835.1 hypothetical protein FC94_GL001832 [Lactobacillus kefiranofaciens subsp. kefirgranum DSM 10550 = JCM 8572]KRM19501.1 hypothetical protein FC93_GL002226 [Lactobacillus kefiranofaciens subsp. kefiranofaciens DSM 5016 = JCM 6985]MCJ2171247.1 hypothetical protein [Lactobacillus kefiranofaciens]MCP9329969.1 hypothetical protein [Lactobacillus 